MTTEKLGINTYMNPEGDIVTDVGPEGVEPTSNSSIIQGTANLAEARFRDAQMQESERETRENRVIDEGLENPGVHVSLEQYYQDQLTLLDTVLGADSKAGFEKGGQHTDEAAERYQERLPRVVKGARANRVRMVNHDVLKPYHAQELIEAGVGYEEDVLHDARTTVPSEVRSRYGGQDNEKARAARRKHLKEQLAKHATNNAA